MQWRKAGHYLDRVSQAVPVSAVSLRAKRYPVTAAEQNARGQRIVALCKELRENKPTK